MSPYFLSTSRRLPTSGGGSCSFAPSRRESSAIWQSPYHPWAQMLTLSRFCGISGRRQRCQPTGSSPTAACSCRHREAVASANIARVKKPCTWTARAVFCGGGLQVPGWLALFATTGRAETPLGGGVKDLQRLLDGLMRQQHRLPPRTIGAIVPLPHHHSLQGGAFAILPIPALGVLCGPLLVVGGQGRKAHALGLQPCGPPVLPLAVRHGVHAAGAHAFPRRGQRLGIRRHAPVRWRWDHKAQALRGQPPPGSPVQKPAVQEDPLPAGRVGQLGARLVTSGRGTVAAWSWSCTT